MNENPKKSRPLKKLIIDPFNDFVQLESSSGIILFAATIIVLIWANSPFGYVYELLWTDEIGFTIEHIISLHKPLILWINDGLMAIFFFLIGLEIKRELFIGELNTLKKASFPLLGALGGMLIPVIIYLILNENPATTKGWGIPMATDIAFSLAILKLLGDKVPLGLKVFLTAFAIVDDIGAILVIAIFYSENIKWMLIIYSLVLLAFLYFMSYKNFYSRYIYLILGFIIWLLFLKSGIHPTVAGILIAFSIPIRKKVDISQFYNKMIIALSRLKNNDGKVEEGKHLLTNYEIKIMDSIEGLSENVQSPLQALEHKLHGWVAYAILPVFALANAGIVFSSEIFNNISLSVILAISLIFGNIIGVTLFTYLGVKLKLTDLPEGVDFMQVFGISCLAGLGFTMSIFITNLAFVEPEFINAAKFGILIGSIIAGISGYVVLKYALKDKTA